MDVACSTLCFSRQPLEVALRRIAEMEFPKVDLVVAEGGPHVTPQETAADLSSISRRIRQAPTVAFAAVTAQVEPDGETAMGQLGAVAQLAHQLAAPYLVVDAAPSGTPLDVEVERLTRLERLAALEGIILSVTTKTGTLTEEPLVAVELCQKVAGLVLTLDPSHYICGPNQGRPFDDVFPYVRHTHLRDTGRRKNQFQVRVGRGEVEFSRIINTLGRYEFTGSLTVAIDDRDQPADDDIEGEIRRLRLLLESLA